jgi:hypothetical protein
MENVGPMIVAMIVATFHFFVVLINLEFDKLEAKFFVAVNFVFGAMNLAVAIKYLVA